MTLSAEDRFNIEVIKLLLKLAWSDREISESERRLVFGLGRSWNLPEAELHTLMTALQSGDKLPEPDLAVLRSRPDEVLEAARALSTSDGQLAEGETLLLQRITSLLRQG